MLGQRTRTQDHKLRLVFSFLVVWMFVGSAFGQTGQRASSAPASEQGERGYTLGPADVLSITVGDSPELTGRYRVAETGYIVLPGLSPPIKAQGLTPLELSTSIAEALKAAEFLREPRVNVFVEQYRSKTVTVLGAVGRPSVYPLEKPTTLLETLSLAGGLLPNSGPNITVAHKGSPPGFEGLSEAERAQLGADWTQTIDIAKLMEGKSPALNIALQAGDIVSVSTAPVIYVAGGVTRPGAFVLQDPRAGVTVLQALAMAEGLRSVSAPRRSLIVRRSQNGQNRQEIPINVAKLMAGKAPDQPLEANDILFIPESGFKKGTHRMADVAISTASTLVFYGLGTRIQRR